MAAATSHLGLAREPLVIAGRVVAALAMLALGEGLRRGIPAWRVAQVVLMGLITAVGIASSAVLIGGHGSAGLVFSTLIELIYAPLIAWWLLNGKTAAWFAAVRGRGGGPRTSGLGWVLVLAAWSVGWGVAVAWSQSL